MLNLELNAGTILNLIAFLFAAVGAVDFLFDSKFGLGTEFERGLASAGKLIIVMAGYMTLAPVLGSLLFPVIQPFAEKIGADPSLLAGILLANDSGGAALAEALAIDPAAKDFNGYIVASMLGGAVTGLTPMVFVYTDERTRKPALYGLCIGLVPMPIGSFIGGLVAGFSPDMMIRNLIPGIIVSAILLVALLFFTKYVIGPLQIIGKILLAISLFGLLCAASETLLSVTIVPGTQPFKDIIAVLGGIALVLSGIFPLLKILTKLLEKPLIRLSERTGYQRNELFSVLVASVNLLPAMDELKNMSPKGILLTLAFIGPGTCVIGDHFAFTSQTNPDMLIPMMAAKLSAAVIAIFLAVLLSNKLIPAENNNNCNNN